MSKICQITGKKAMVGNNVSHSKRRTKRTFDVTLVKTNGKNSNRVFFLPKLLLNLTSASTGVLDFKLKSGALEPMRMGIFISWRLELLNPPLRVL